MKGNKIYDSASFTALDSFSFIVETLSAGGSKDQQKFTF